MVPPIARRTRGSRTHSIERALSDPGRYAAQIERLHRRYLGTPQLYGLQQSGVTLGSMVMGRRRLARALARSVRHGEYVFQPARARDIEVKGKVRSVYSMCLTDQIVNGVVADALRERIEPLLAPSLYSYRSGMSWWSAVSDFARFVRTRRRASHPDLYVLRRDIKSYTESIPVVSGAPLWDMLTEVGAGSSLGPSAAVVKYAVRPEIATPEGTVRLERGVPTGQPIASVLANLYLRELDDLLSAEPGGFYARYSDDFVFAHPDAEVAARAGLRIHGLLSDLGLQVNASKQEDLFLTRAGRQSMEWSGSRGATGVPFLGMTVTANGTICLTKDKARSFIRDIRRRAETVARASRDRDTDALGALVCATVNRALRSATSSFPHPSAMPLARVVTDRPALRQLDYLVARAVVAAVTGRRDVRSFRLIPYRKLRHDWGLLSLEDMRNRAGGG